MSTFIPRVPRRALFGVIVSLAALFSAGGGTGIARSTAATPPFTGVCTSTAAFGSNVMTNCDSTVLPHFETTIAIDPNDPEHLVGGSIANEVPPSGGILQPFGRPPTGAKFLDDYFTSFDGGTTWLNGQVPSGQGVSMSDPTITFDSRGKVYYESAPFVLDSSGTPRGLLQVSRSDDGGRTFNTPVIVDRTLGATGDDEPAVAADANLDSPHRDSVYMTWEQLRPGGQSPILFSVSHDAGQTWSPPKEINGANAAVCTFAIDSLPYDGSCRDSNRSWTAVGPDGTIYVAFHNIQADAKHPTNGQILVVNSIDGGVTWSAPVRASDIIPEERLGLLNNSQFVPGAFPSLAVDPSTKGTLYIVWFDNRNGDIDNIDKTNVDVFFVKSTDFGVHWSSPQAVSTALGDQFQPYAAVGPDGTLNVSFMDRSYDLPANSKYGVTLARLKPGAGTFTLQRVDTGLSDPNHALWFSSPPGGQTGFLGDYTGLAVGSDGVAHPIWTDMRRVITVDGFSGTTEDIMTAAVPPLISN